MKLQVWGTDCKAQTHPLEISTVALRKTATLPSLLFTYLKNITHHLENTRVIMLHLESVHSFKCETWLEFSLSFSFLGLAWLALFLGEKWPLWLLSSPLKFHSVCARIEMRWCQEIGWAHRIERFESSQIKNDVTPSRSRQWYTTRLNGRSFPMAISSISSSYHTGLLRRRLLRFQGNCSCWWAIKKGTNCPSAGMEFPTARHHCTITGLLWQ